MKIKKITALGDSITWGYPNGNSWTNLLSTYLNIEIKNHGLNGDTLSGMLYRLKEDIIPDPPDLCILTGGTNDVLQDYTLIEMKNNLQSIVDELKKNNILAVVGITIPLLYIEQEKVLNEFRNWIQDNFENTIPFHLDFLKKDNTIKAGLLPDGSHPSTDAYNKMALCAQKVIENIISN